jgi:hypothetical protein
VSASLVLQVGDSEPFFKVCRFVGVSYEFPDLSIAMSHRYRLEPTEDNLQILMQHCSHARAVWNLGLEQANLYNPLFGSTPNNAQRQKQLAEVRKCSYLGEGSSSVQQAALNDLDQAFKNWWGGSQ